jgi:hypothetical protein
VRLSSKGTKKVTHERTSRLQSGDTMISPYACFVIFVIPGVLRGLFLACHNYMIAIALRRKHSSQCKD